MVKLSHSAQEAQKNDRDRFLAALFVPEPVREGLMALIALNAELAHVPHVVREEMIGHIRYAWWQESIEALYEGQVRHGHPLLEALGKLLDEGYLSPIMLSPLVEAYRNQYPELPPNIDRLMDTATITLLRSLAPRSEKAWRRARTVIARHRNYHGDQANGWLSFNLLLAGLF